MVKGKSEGKGKGGKRYSPYEAEESEEMEEVFNDCELSPAQQADAALEHDSQTLSTLYNVQAGRTDEVQHSDLVNGFRMLYQAAHHNSLQLDFGSFVQDMLTNMNEQKRQSNGVLTTSFGETIGNSADDDDDSDGGQAVQS